MHTRPAGRRRWFSLRLPRITALIVLALACAGSGALKPLPSHAGDNSSLSPHTSAGPARNAPHLQDSCPPGFVIDFSGLPAGTILDEQYAAYGVHISAIGNRDHPNAAIIFNSDGSGSNDPDMEVGIGNLSILARNLKDENADGLVDFPDENNYGGVQVFNFDQPVRVDSFVFVDKDHGTPDKAVAYGASNDVIKTALIPVAGSGSVQTINVDAENVSRLEIVYRDSGGLTRIVIGCSPPATTTPTPSPTPTPRIVIGSATPSATPGVLEVVRPPVLPVQLPKTGSNPRS